jgi:hypothetical protein
VPAGFGGRLRGKGPHPPRTRDLAAQPILLRRLIAAGCIPDRAGQSTQIVLQLPLSQLAGLPGTGPDQPAQDGDRPRGDRPCGDRPCGDRPCGDRPGDPAGTGWTGPGPLAGPGDDCDASIAPIVTGHVDHELLDRLAAILLRQPPPGTSPASPANHDDTTRPGHACARDLILRHAVALLSGPAGLAARLRTSRLTGPAATISLPLDTGTPADTIPPHLRRAVIHRDQHCAFPSGCDQPPAACQVHHIIPRNHGGPTTLTNLSLQCTFHHLIAIHRWGWTLTLHPDGTYTATTAPTTPEPCTATAHQPPPPDSGAAPGPGGR